MKACEQTTGKYNEEQYKLYIKLIEEEFGEFKTALDTSDKVEQLDALIDMIVVIVGALHSAGFDGEGAWKEVMGSNFAKIDKLTGKVRKREDGKVLKPTNWMPPQLAQFTGDK
jgi:predicted HAD superfamily Cof-like phosphohydrolase